MSPSAKLPPWFLLLPLLVLVAALGMRSLNADAIWYDEYWSLYYAGSPPHYGPVTLMETWTRVAGEYHELNPPGYYLLLNVWGQIVGSTVFAVRSLSLFTGLLALAVIYRLGCDLDGRWAGWGAALSLGLSAYFIIYLHEARAYMLMALLTAASLLVYWRLLWQPRFSLVLMAAFVVCTSGLLYTHYMGIPVILTAGLYHLLVAPKDRRWLVITGLAALAALCFIPWISVALGAVQQVAEDPARNFYANPWLTLTMNVLNQFSNASPLLLLVVGWYALRHVRSRAGRFMLILLMGSWVVSLLLNEMFRFITGVRYLLALWPLLALLTGLGIAVMRRLQLRPLVLMAVWGGAGIMLSLWPDAQLNTDGDWLIHLNWDTVAAEVRLLAQPDDLIIYYLPQPLPYWIHAPVAAYYLHDLPAQVQPFPPFAHPPQGVPVESASLYLVESLLDKPPAAYRTEADELLAGRSTVTIAYHPTHRPGPFTQSAFDAALAESGFTLCESVIARPDLFLGLYARLNTQAELRMVFSPGITLDVLTPVARSVHDRLGLILRWIQDVEVPRGLYSFGLHLEDEAGNFVTSFDSGLPLAADTCQRVSLDTSDLASGVYQVRLVIYNWQTGERLTEGQTDADTRPLLGRFIIGDS